jgi:single-strand DNA-binding protein
MNQITMIGNITRDPELRYTPNGAPVAEFGIAVIKTRDGQGEFVSDFFNCNAWGKQAENIAESIKTGNRVIIIGKLYVEKWEDKKNGEKKQAVKIRVDNLGAELTYATCKIIKNLNNDKNPQG